MLYHYLDDGIDLSRLIKVYPGGFLKIPRGLCLKPGTQNGGTECGEHGDRATCYGPRNVAKYTMKCPSTFQGISSDIPGNAAKHFGEYPEIFT